MTFLRIDTFTASGVTFTYPSRAEKSQMHAVLGFRISIWSWWRSKLRNGLRFSECVIRHDLEPKVELGKGSVFYVGHYIFVVVLVEFDKAYRLQNGMVIDSDAMSR